MRVRIALLAIAVASIVAFHVSTSSTDAGAPTGVTMSIDCNVNVAGIQSNCMVSNMTAMRDVNIVMRNNGPATIRVGTFTFRAQNPDLTRLFAPNIQGTQTETLDDNPDASPAIQALTSFDCPNSGFNDDPNTAEPGQDSFLICYDRVSAGLPVASGSVLHLATVHYNIVAGADSGSVPLTITEGGVFSNEFDNLGTCAPVTGVPMVCNPATITLYCPIEVADVNDDGRVNIADVWLVAKHQGELPAPARYDQNFDGRINIADRGIVLTHYSKYVSQCP